MLARRDGLDSRRSGSAEAFAPVRRFNASPSTAPRLADTGTSPGVTVEPRIDADTERAARVFMQRLEGKYPVVEAILFGSRARGTHTAESDADIAVVLEGTKGNRNAVGGDMAGIAFDVMMETGVLVEALPLWADEWQRPETFSNPALILNIQRDGVRL
jgi:predicted nucleotidyltransferase